MSRESTWSPGAFTFFSLMRIVIISLGENTISFLLEAVAVDLVSTWDLFVCLIYSSDLVGRGFVGW